MMDDLRKGITERREAIKSNIYKSITNKEEVTMSDEARAFHDDIQKGEVEVITREDLRETYGDRFFAKGNVDELNARLEGLIKKGEEESISEDEYEFLTANLEATEGLILKAMPVASEGAQKYVPVYVAIAKEED